MATKVKWCFVPSCINNSKNSNKLFIHLPNNKEMAGKWFLSVGRPLQQNTIGIYCCEDHFVMEDDCENWTAFKLMRNRIKMKKTVLPHKNLIDNQMDRQYSQLSDSAKKRKLDVLKRYTTSAQPRFDQGTSSAGSTVSICDHDIEETPLFIRTIEKGIQVAPSTRTVSTNTIKSRTGHSILFHESKLQHLSPSSTGSTSGSLYSAGTSIASEKSEIVKPKRMEMNMCLYKNYSRFYVGLPEKTFFLITLIEEKTNLKQRDILLVLKKIRLNDPYVRLAHDFDLTVTSVSVIFNKTLPILASVFKKFIIWPERDLIKRNLPIPFRKRYSEIQSIIDCFEIQIEKPSNAIHQSLTWSNYKKTNTIKYLISSLPDGLINFISMGFGGRITDEEIVKQSDYMNILPNDCEVMADRGFKNIETLLWSKKCKLVRPPSVEQGIKSTPEEVKLAKRIASLRIHIERVIGRIREFDILKPHACINNKLLCSIDDIVIVVCGIINVQGPLIKV